MGKGRERKEGKGKKGEGKEGRKERFPRFHPDKCIFILNQFRASNVPSFASLVLCV